MSNKKSAEELADWLRNIVDENARLREEKAGAEKAMDEFAQSVVELQEDVGRLEKEAEQPESALDRCCEFKEGTYLQHTLIRDALREIRDRLKKVEREKRDGD